MQLGMIGLGRMGAAMVRRLMRAGHDCVVYNLDPEPVALLAAEGATPSASLEEFVGLLEPRRVVWVMIPAGAVDSVVGRLTPLLESGDIVIDGGNSHYRDDMARAASLAERGIAYVDAGTSGGVFGEERGYCLMVGGEGEAVGHIEPVLADLAPGVEGAERTAGRRGPPSQAERGYLHCGPPGAGHFVKMVHNGIEYGLMAAYAEGFNLLHHANIGAHEVDVDAETTPLREPDAYRFELDVAEIAELWRRGSVIPSWLLDLTAASLAEAPTLDGFEGRVSDSGEGRWTVMSAVETGVPAPVLSAALYGRFASRGRDDFANKVMSAMRFQFGGHHEKTADDAGGTSS
ncbi:MAG: decarboxylating 6-phosphogluconate dehydrogenase [Microthrixaceae bacterium]